MSQEPFIQKLTLRNFRSIRNETVTFANPLFLVGRNGSGKSNFVDALAFLSECVASPLVSVIDRRGGLGRLLRAEYEPPFHLLHLGFRVDFNEVGTSIEGGHYAVAMRRSITTDIEVVHEQCVVALNNGSRRWFDRTGSTFRTNLHGLNPSVDPEALALPIVGGTAELSSLIKEFGAVRVYNIEPNRLRDIQDPDSGLILKRDGSNTASVIQQLRSRNKDATARISQLLSPVVPGIDSIEATKLGNKIDLIFIHELKGYDADMWPIFSASDMSDGTLRALGFVAAALQESAPSLMAIEEPEATIHPGALDTIANIIEIAALRSQVVITTHSPDLLDTKWIQPENLRVVEWENGATHISELGEAPVKALQQHLMGAGELLRANALDAAPSTPDSEDVSDLFESSLA